jgi:hypothetical protein
MKFTSPPVVDAVPPIPEIPAVEPPPAFSVLNRTPKQRYEHTLILAASGHGKTQLISEMVAADLFAPCSSIVFDSQGDLVHSVLKVDVPSTRIALIDPTDIEHPIAMGLFDFNTSGATAFEREKNLNTVIELLSFVLNSLLDSQMTAKQDVCLRFAIRLCLVIPEANIHTLRDVFSSNFQKYDPFVNELSDTAQQFFKQEFQTKQFSETREQILRRIYSLLENQSLERMFTAPKSKLNIAQLLDDGTVLLINSAKSFLKEQGSAFFTRFMLARIFQAIQERDPLKDNLPCYLYLDEAGPIIDDTVKSILETARKYNFGVTLAFHSLGEISATHEHAIVTNTGTKCVGGISAKDSRALADDMRVQKETLLSVPRLQFYCHTHGELGTVHKVTTGALGKLPKRTNLKAFIAQNRERFYSPPVPKSYQDDSVIDI